MNTSTVKENYQDVAVARAYDRERFQSLVGRTFDRLEKRALHNIVRRALREVPRASVLDAPCGTGRITEWLLGLGLSVTGGDISSAMIEMARDKCARFADRAEFRTLDLEHLELADDSFDLVTCIRLFHHLDTLARERILRELARVSRAFVIVNVSLSSPYYRCRRGLKRWLGQGVSTTSSTWAEIESEAAAAGLEVAARRFVLPYLSEDLVLLLRKSSRTR
jgi:ubiquinone/menaquinone biosynthesis C-methylase UbiE